MRVLTLVARDSMLSELEALLCKNGVRAYTTISNIKGVGVAGRVYGTFLHPDINTIICAVLPNDLADQAIAALRTWHDERKATSHDDKPIPLKVFSFPCEEHV